MPTINVVKTKHQFDLRSVMFKDIHDYTKIYPDRIRVVRYHRPIVKPWAEIPHSGSGIEHNEQELPAREDSQRKSMNRTKTTISDYVLCNNFSHFATFTFDPKIIGENNRHNFDYCNKLFSEWLRVEQQHHQRKFNAKFKYLVVPEQHKDGAWHFHALLENYLLPTLNFTDPSNKWLSRTDKPRQNRLYFKRYNLGRNELQPIKSRERMASYIKKYITKSLIEKTGCKRYWSSRNLAKPQIVYNIFKYDQIPPSTLTFETDFFSIYEITPSLESKLLRSIQSLFSNLSSRTETSRITERYYTAAEFLGGQLQLF